MSPEQCGGQKISPQSDQYSLGILGFQMLTGEVPFNADSMVGVIQHHYMTPVPDIRAVRNDVPQELLDIIYCSLNKAPEDRFTTTREMAQALEAIPQSETDREEAERLLRELSTGKTIPKVRTGTLPPLTLTISGPSAPVVPRPVAQPRKPITGPGSATKRRKKKKKNKMMVPALAAFVILAGGGVYMMNAQQKEQDRLTRKARADSIALAEARRGGVVITNVPADVRVTINNVAYKNGDTAFLEPKTYPARVEGRNFATTFPDITIDSGTVAPRDFAAMGDIIPSNAGSGVTAPLGGSQQATPQQSGTRASASAAVADSGELRLTVTPLTATIWVDNENKGTGRRFIKLPVGVHEVRFTLTGCTSVTRRLQVTKGEALPHNEPLVGPDCK
jgi:hypothetical protein